MCSLKNGFLGSFCSAAYPPCTAFFSRKHFGHSLKKHVVGFKVVCKNQLAFFSGTSSLNQSTFVDLNRHFLANVPGKAPHINIYIYIHTIPWIGCFPEYVLMMVNFGV